METHGAAEVDVSRHRAASDCVLLAGTGMRNIPSIAELVIGHDINDEVRVRSPLLGCEAESPSFRKGNKK